MQLIKVKREPKFLLVKEMTGFSREDQFVIRDTVPQNRDIAHLLHCHLLCTGTFSNQVCFFNPIRRGGGWISSYFFQPSISPWKRGLEVPNFVTFPNSLWTFRKAKQIFLVFHSVLGWSRRCGLIQPPLHSSNIQEPPLLGLRHFPPVTVVRCYRIYKTFCLIYYLKL